MSDKVAILTDKAPAPRPVYSQAIKANGFIFCSGQTPKDLSGKTVEGTVVDRTAVLEAAGSGMDKVVEVNVFLADMDDFAAVNEEYEKHFTSGIKPARTCVAVKTLPGNTDVEIKCTALA